MNILDIAIAKKLAGGGGGSGTDDYNDLSNLPKINGATLSGNKSSSALGLQSEINSESKLASDLVDDTNQDNKFVTSTEKQTWNAKQNAIDADHKINADYVDDSTSTNKFVTASDKETWNAKQNAIDNSHKLSSDLVDDTNHTNKFVTSSEKRTWNAKQNAIDSDHKLSSSLVSFTTAEAAALASGIDGTKVGQISTNQTNILYALKRTGENYLPVTSGTVNNGYIMKLEPVNIKAGNYTFSFKAASGYSGNYQIDLYQADGTTKLTVQGAVSGSVVRNIGITNDTYYVTLYFSGAVTASEIMLCHEERRTVDDSFVDYSLPNYDLTRLESEDRAALAEVVDSGAKNKYQITQASTTGYTVNSDNTVTVSGALSNSEFNMGNFLTGTLSNLVLSGCTGGSSSTYCLLFQYRISGGNVQFIRQYDEPVVINLTNVTWSSLYIEVKSLSSGQTKVFKPMICTKAAFGVSQKFVPYKPETVKGWTKLKEQTANSDTFTLDLANMNEVMVLLIYTSGSRVYSNTFPQYILEAGYKAVVSMVDSNNPTNDVCTLQKSGSTYSGTIPSNSFKMIIYGR